MKTKTTITLLGLWVAIAAVVAFLISVSIAASAQAQKDYLTLADATAATHTASADAYVSSLQASFVALHEVVENFEGSHVQRRVLLREIAEAHPQITHIGVNRLVNAEDGSAAEPELSSRVMELESGGLQFLPLGDLPTREFAIAIRGRLGDAGDVFMIVYSPEVLTAIINSVELPHGGRLVLSDGVIALDLGRVIAREEVLSDESPNEGWHAAIIGNAQQAGREAGEFRGLLVLTIVLCLLGAGGTFLIMRSHAAPLDTLSAAVSRAKRGDKSVWVDMPKRNEYGAIAARFNDFMESINPKPDEESAHESEESSEKGGKSAKKSEKLLISRMCKDAVTGAYTGTSIKEYIAELSCPNADADAGVSKTFEPFAVISVGVRGFDEFVSTHSHTSGDLQLKFVTLALRRALREFSLKGRIGRENEHSFLVVINAATQSTCAKVGEKITALLRSGYTEDSGERIRVRVKLSRAVITDTPPPDLPAVYHVLTNLESL